MASIPLITRGAVLRLPFTVLAAWGIYKLIEPYVKGSPKSKAVSAKNTGIREGVTKFLCNYAGKGGVWDAVQLADIRQIAHLSDPRMLAVIDGAEGRALLEKLPQKPEAVIKREDYHKDVARLIILVVEFDAANQSRNHAETLLRELLHHAEFRDGYFSTPNYDANKLIRERNASYFDAAIRTLKEIDGLLKSNFRKGDDRPLAPDAVDDVVALGDALCMLLKLEQGEGTKLLADAENITPVVRLKPNLDFLKRKFGCRISSVAVYTHLISGACGNRAKVAALSAGPIIGIEQQYWKEMDGIKAFAQIHYKKPAEQEAHVAEAEKRVEEKYKRDRKQMIDWLSESFRKPVPVVME